MAIRIKDRALNPIKLELPSGDAIALSGQSVEREVERTGRGLGETGQPVLATSSGKPQTSPVIDPVALVREEIINKQTQILKEAVAICFILIRPAFSMEQFKDYLKNHQKLVTDALENPVTKRDIEAQLQQAEVSGYKKFNQEFAKVARPVAWDGPSTTGEKTQVVKNKAGQEVCTLKEKTSSQVFTAPDGSTKQVSICSGACFRNKSGSLSSIKTGSN